MAFRLRGFVLSLLAFSTMLTGAIVFTDSFMQGYGTSFDNPELKSLQNEVNSSVASNIRSTQAEASQIGGGISEGLFVLKGVWNVISTTIASIGVVEFIMGWMQDHLGIPSWFLTLVVLSTVTMVVYEIVTLYRGIRT